MALLNLFSLADNMPNPSGVWEWFLLRVFDFVANYGWRVVVFTLLLKLALSPLDIYSRIMMRKNQKITERIKPEMEKLQAQYGHDRATLSQKQMQLNKREGMSYMSACLPMIVPMIIFIWMFSGLRSISEYMTMRQYLQIYDSYQTAYTQVYLDNEYEWVENADGTGSFKLVKDFGGDTLAKEKHMNETESAAITAGQKQAFDDYYEKYKVDFLWVKNVWSPDVPWKKPILDFSQFKSSINKYGKDHTKVGVSDEMLKYLTTNEVYDKVTKLLREDPSNKSNGYLVLPILSVALMFLSQFITMRLQKKSGQQLQGTGSQSMKMMMIIMPLIFGFFALSYTSIFTLYNIISTITSLIITQSIGIILRLADKRSNTKTNVAGRTAGGDQIVRYGRPDPNDIKNTKADEPAKNYKKNIKNDYKKK